MSEPFAIVDRRAPRPRDGDPNGNPVPPPGPGATGGGATVGPNADPGFGDTHVMFPAGQPQVQPWQGWPVGWATPDWEGQGGDGSWLAGWTHQRHDGGWRRRVSTVFACVDLNARTLSAMPVVRSRSAVPMDPPAWSDNPMPDAYASWGDWIKSTVVALMLRGEAIVVSPSHYAPTQAQRDAGLPGWPRTFFTAHPDAVEIRDEPLGGWGYYWRKTGERIGWDGTGETLLHLRYLTVPGDRHGQGPLEAAYSNLVSAGALSRYGADLADRGGVPWGVLRAKTNLGAGGAQRLQSQWMEGARSRGMGAPAVLTGDFDLERLTLDPKSMALLELREFDEMRLAAAFGVPGPLVGLPQAGSSMTYSSPAMVLDFHWRATLKPLANNIMTALSNWALPRGQGVHLSAEDYVQQDFAQRSQGYQMMFNAGAITIDEWREQEGLGPIADADARAAVGATNNETPGQVD